MPRFHLVSVISLLLLSITAAAFGKSTVYVARFVDQDRQQSELARKFTRDFEQALVLSNCYTVLESTEFSSLLTEKDRELEITNIAQLSNTSLENLKTKEAEMVVFGEVYDDVDSGQINITVTFQRFDRTKVLIKNVLLPRGLGPDAASRQRAMSDLARSLCQRTATVRRSIVNDFIFELEGCHLQDRTATCNFLVTNNGEDRDLALYKPNWERVTRIYDDASRVTVASRLILAGFEPGHRYAWLRNTLISGRPAELQVIFDGVSSKASLVSRLNLECWESENGADFSVAFRNVPLTR